MTHRNENSVLFSLGHLQQLAMATSANRQTTFGPPRPMYQHQPVEPLPVAFSPSAAVLAPRAGWPSWLAPLVIGIGVLFIGFLVLALVVAMRPAEVRRVPAKPTALSKAKAAVAPAPAPVAAVAKPTPPKPEATAIPSALPAKVPAAEKVVEKPVADPPAKKKKLTKSKRKRLAKARLRRRRRLRRKRRRARARARRAKRRRARRITTRSRRSSRYKPYGKLGDRDLDAILNAAGR